MQRLKHVNVGVIGLGMGRYHLADYLKHPGCTVVAICDSNDEYLERVAKSNGVDAAKCFTSIDALFRAAPRLKLDAVSIALPNVFHAPVSISALRAGLHVMCEKPIAMNATQGRRMIDAARKARRTLGLNLSFRFQPQSRTLKDLVTAGRIGRPYYAHTRWLRQRGLPGFGGWFGQKKLSGGGPIIDLGVHRLDLAMWLMGGPEPVTVSAATYNPIGSRLARAEGKAFDVEDFGSAFIRFKGGEVIALEASWAGFSGRSEDISTEILGDLGGIFPRNPVASSAPEASVCTEEGGALVRTVVARRLVPSPSPYHDFIEALLEGRPTMAPAEDGLRVQRILDGIYRSAALGREVRLA